MDLKVNNAYIVKIGRDVFKHVILELTKETIFFQNVDSASLFKQRVTREKFAESIKILEDLGPYKAE